MRGIDDQATFWLAVGALDGNPINGEGSHDGEDAWSLGDQTTLYLCNTTLQGIKARGMVFRRENGSGEPAWTQVSRWAGPGESVEWAAAKTNWSSIYQPLLFVDRFTMEKIDLVSFNEAVDGDHGISVNGWIGLADAGEAFDGVDVAWSDLLGSYGAKTVSMNLQGPAKMRFRWKCSGSGSLGLRLDGAWLPVAVPGADWQEVEFEVYGPALVEWLHQPTTSTHDEAPGDAWLDAITIESRPPRTIGVAAGEGSGLAFGSTAGATGADQWRAVAYRDAGGVWQEGARGITGAAGLQTTVTGPALLSFRTYCAGVRIPPPVVNVRQAQSVSVQGPGGGGARTTQRFLSVKVGNSEKLRIIPERNGWTEHLVHVPAGEHPVVWRLGGALRMTSSAAMQEWQAWVGGVTLQHPRAHYDSWADLSLEGSTAREPGDDADGDGVINFVEYAYASDPQNGSSKPAATFGLVQPPRSLTFGGLRVGKFALHVARLPAHVTAVLKTSADLVTWTPSPIPLRSVTYLNLDAFSVEPRDYDSGIHQVILFDMIPEQFAQYFRIDFELPTNGD